MHELFRGLIDLLRVIETFFQWRLDLHTSLHFQPRDRQINLLERSLSLKAFLKMVLHD
jgi:hypothetical protein